MMAKVVIVIVFRLVFFRHHHCVLSLPCVLAPHTWFVCGFSEQVQVYSRSRPRDSLGVLPGW